MGSTTAFGAGEEGMCHLVDLALLFCFQERVVEFSEAGLILDLVLMIFT